MATIAALSFDKEALAPSCRPLPSRWLVVLLFCCVGVLHGDAEEDASGFGGPNTVIISSVYYPQMQLKPFQWNYIRVELPAWFSSISLGLETNLHIDIEELRGLPMSKLPLICYQNGRPPLPDAPSSDLNPGALDLFHEEAIVNGLNKSGMEHCFFFQRDMVVTLTNEQIIRGLTYTFAANVTILGCISPLLGGPYCNQTLDMISCALSDKTNQRNLLDLDPREAAYLNTNGAESDIYLLGNSCLSSKGNLCESRTDVSSHWEGLSISRMSKNVENVTVCKNSKQLECLRIGDVKMYSLDVTSMAFQVDLSVQDVKNKPNISTGSSVKDDSVQLICLARHNAIPSRTLYDYSADLSLSPLTIPFPKIGKWFISIYVLNPTSLNTEQNVNASSSICFSFKWQIYACATAKGGEDCQWESHMLQRVVKRGTVPFESYYVPNDQFPSTMPAKFPLEPLLSNSSSVQNWTSSWTYFLVDVPYGAAGGNIHVHIKSDSEIRYEIYARLGGLPSIDLWDYLNNGSSYSKDSMFLASQGSSLEEKGNFYVLYATEGTWCFGLRDVTGGQLQQQITMSVTLEGCPNGCYNHGTCHSAVDESGLSIYSYCACDRNHGGLDCSFELISPRGAQSEGQWLRCSQSCHIEQEHIWQSICLIVSNGAALLPAFWSIHQKAIAEWILFTSSGISSALYHSCDVGTWCSLPYHVLQFLDFWLSFMAVVSTFIYMAAIDNASKRAMQMGVSILTALLAENGPTRTVNVVIVLGIGILGLLVGWMIEMSPRCTAIHFFRLCHLNLLVRWGNLKQWVFGMIGTLRRRFRWRFLFTGFFLLSMAAVCWNLETSQSYWIFHSLWHISIYSSSFFFLCSTVNNTTSSEENQERDYELVRQNSTGARVESRGT
ncbi:uncharacterized protein LOC116252268 isoform X3 [Nymphaea colorata]|uniref:uncharacterized protein LOC116252268 isoform X3 n=1 Tax=Nymphaea colorata TaxID=210225 RepID=UPI00129D7862|nr:uncharacterized protein LOC116252268 isoform X3 [Nymphaea colorata]